MKHAVRMVFVEGQFAERLSDMSAMPKDAVFSLSENDFSLSLPEGASLVLVEEHTGKASQKNQSHMRTDITLAAGASLDYLKLQDLPEATQHVATLRVEQAQQSSLRAGFFSLGGESERQDVAIHQLGAHASSLLYGFCQPVRDHQQMDHTVEISHAAPHGQSRMLYKGILAAKSRASFRGRVKVSETGKAIRADQGSHYLLLSKEAEAISRPELEIYQDDIQCSHGATVGQLDEAALFYLRSRGIQPADAEKMLRTAFVMDLFDMVTPMLRTWLCERLGVQYEA